MAKDKQGDFIRYSAYAWTSLSAIIVFWALPRDTAFLITGAFCVLGFIQAVRYSKYAP